MYIYVSFIREESYKIEIAFKLQRSGKDIKNKVSSMSYLNNLLFKA